eukprot:scaffold181821_cov29-Tisochrysis_lutea.AAC.4
MRRLSRSEKPAGVLSIWRVEGLPPSTRSVDASRAARGRALFSSEGHWFAAKSLLAEGSLPQLDGKLTLSAVSRGSMRRVRSATSGLPCHILRNGAFRQSVLGPLREALPGVQMSATTDTHSAAADKAHAPPRGRDSSGWPAAASDAARGGGLQRSA